MPQIIWINLLSLFNRQQFRSTGRALQLKRTDRTSLYNFFCVLRLSTEPATLIHYNSYIGKVA